MARSGRAAKRGKLAVQAALVTFVVALLAMIVLVVAVVQTVGAGVAPERDEFIDRGWLVGGLIALVAAACVAIATYMNAGKLASRLTDLALAVAKLGRGTSEVRVRVSGNDEAGALGRAVQYLATDLAAMAAEAQKGGGVAAASDPQLREIRDRTVPQAMTAPEGFEVDGAIVAGGRGGLDYYDVVAGGEGSVLYLVSAEGQGAASALAVRMARDEIGRALAAGANARKALAHTNRVLQKNLARGVCAKAVLIEFGGDEAKLYQAGYRAPTWLCSRGELQAISAEGLALGLDEGSVFEKALRSTKIPLAQGVRIVQVNEAGGRLPDLADAVKLRSPMNTMSFMNMVLGAVESDAGAEGLREDVVLLTVKRW